MKMYFTLTTTIALLLGAGLPISILQAQEEWEESSPYYEDDAWYDISEWFDGNDYNPTDEEILEWDDETYEESDEVEGPSDNDEWYGGTSRDDDREDEYWEEDSQFENTQFDSDSALDDESRDDEYLEDDDEYLEDDDEYLEDYVDYDFRTYSSENDTFRSFGFNDLYRDDNWFYDFYDEGYANYYDYDDDGLYEYGYRYYDFDNDSAYDGFTAFSDADQDGIYEDIRYYSFDATGEKGQRLQATPSQQSNQQMEKSSRRQSVTGTIREMKRASVRDTKHLVVEIQRDEGQRILADLGPATDLDQLDLARGDRINVQGPKSKVGDRAVLLAHRVRSHGNSTKVERNHRSFEGKVTDTSLFNVRGDQHLMAKLQTNQKGRQRAIDLGASKDIPFDVQAGTRISVQGAPVEVNGRILVIADSISRDGEEYSIRQGNQVR